MILHESFAPLPRFPEVRVCEGVVRSSQSWKTGWRRLCRALGSPACHCIAGSISSCVLAIAENDEVCVKDASAEAARITAKNTAS